MKLAAGVAWVKNCTLTGPTPLCPRSNSRELRPVRSRPPQQPRLNGAPSRMVLKPSENACELPAAALVSVISSEPLELENVALVLAAPKLRNQSCVPAENV